MLSSQLKPSECEPSATLHVRTAGGRFADMWGPFNSKHGPFSSCMCGGQSLDVSYGTMKDLPWQTWPALCASRGELSSALLVAGCDYIEIQAHSSLHHHNTSRILPENCNVHGGCFHFISVESIFHSFLSLRHIKTEAMKTIWDILVSPLSPIFNFSSQDAWINWINNKGNNKCIFLFNAREFSPSILRFHDTSPPSSRLANGFLDHLFFHPFSPLVPFVSSLFFNKSPLHSRLTWSHRIMFKLHAT